MHNYNVQNMDFSDINPIQCGWEDCRSGHSFGPAIREYHLIHYILSGNGTFQRGDKEYALSSGDMFLIRPNEITTYTASVSDPWKYVWIGFDGNKAESLIERTQFAGGGCCISAGSLSAIFSKIVKEEQDTLSILSAIYEMFRKLELKEDGKRVDYVTEALTFMNANFSMPISISETAEAVGIDRRYLHKLFIETLGVTPKEYLTNIRMETAEKLLKTHDCSVKEAAASVGYEDEFNFSRMFKKKYGVSPLYFKARKY